MLKIITPLRILIHYQEKYYVLILTDVYLVIIHSETMFISYRLRDPEGITWNPSNGIMYDSDNGNIMDDEINIIVKGGNYGWPILQGNESAPGSVEPH